MDAGGKDGVIRNVFTGINPAGVRVHQLRRAHRGGAGPRLPLAGPRRLPGHGEIGVFNRSHYEDVLVVRVEAGVRKRWRRRYEHIRAFERLLDRRRHAIVKLFLNISKEEQRALPGPGRQPRRAVEVPPRRPRGPALWDDYMAAYGTPWPRRPPTQAPWYVVPGDRKWVRNLAVAHSLSTRSTLDPQYPRRRGHRGPRHVAHRRPEGPRATTGAACENALDVSYNLARMGVLIAPLSLDDAVAALGEHPDASCSPAAPT